jgi:hypothetical protein
VESDKELQSLIKRGISPEGRRLRVVDLTKENITSLPPGIRCHTLRSSQSLKELPDDLTVEFKLDLSGCRELRKLPRGLRVPVLVLRGCAQLEALPEDMEVDYLDIQDCTALVEWPESARVSIGSVNARNCPMLRSIPASLGPLTTLDLAGCRKIEAIPAGVRVRSWIDIANTQITSLPEELSHIGLRWRGVAVSAQVAFFAETLAADQILGESNAEVRRVMIERVGFERLLQRVKAEVVHEDRDAGGQRQLLRVRLKDDEDLVCVSVRCPSTGRHYIIRVPPGMRTCHQAVAWTAGFDNADDYRPIAET